METGGRKEDSHPAPDRYEPPHVEEVLDPNDLEREVHYAGTNGSIIIG